MQIMRNFAHGIFTVLKLTGAPLLYRYPYRNSGEALRSDWLKISGDIETVMGRLRESVHPDRSEAQWRDLLPAEGDPSASLGIAPRRPHG